MARASARGKHWTRHEQTSTYVVFAFRRNGVDELGLGHVVFVGALIFLGVLQEVVPCLRRQLRLEFCAQHLLFQRLCDGRHDCESIALQLFCAAFNGGVSGMRSGLGASGWTRRLGVR